MCIVDTDELCTELIVQSATRNGQLLIKRLHENEQHEIELKTIGDPTKKPTEIEDILEPEIFYNSLKSAIEQFGDDSLKDCLNSFDFDKTVKNSRIKGDYSILNPKGNGRNAREDKDQIIQFVDEHKEEIATIYTSFPKSDERPNWVNILLNKLNSNK